MVDTPILNPSARCSKITEKVSFYNIAIIVFGQKFIKMPKMVNFGDFYEPEACSQTVLPDMSILIRQKLVKIAKIEVRHFV